MDWNWNGKGKRKRKELGLEEFSDEGSFDEFSDNSSLACLSWGDEEAAGDQESEKDGEEFHVEERVGVVLGESWNSSSGQVDLSSGTCEWMKVKVLAMLLYREKVHRVRGRGPKRQ